MSRSVIAATLLALLASTALAQGGRALDRASEVGSRLGVEGSVETLRARTREQVRESVAVVISQFKAAGLSPQAQRELERLAEQVVERVSGAWSETQATERFNVTLASSLSLGELNGAVVLYANPENAKATVAICRAWDAMYNYVNTSTDLASRKELPELLRNARQLK
jgi:hypothetical protein